MKTSHVVTEMKLLVILPLTGKVYIHVFHSEEKKFSQNYSLLLTNLLTIPNFYYNGSVFDGSANVSIASHFSLRSF